jgi:hypothetical protein
MGVGYCEVPMSVVYRDIEFMNLETQMQNIKRQNEENDAEHKTKQ